MNTILKRQMFVIVALLLSAGIAAQISIIKFGAIGDGKKINTKAIQNAINACAKNGGGTVIVPAGVFMTGSIELKSNITLELSSGAVLLGSPNLSDYQFNGFQNYELGKAKSLVWAINQNNVSIIGAGLIDFNGKVFMDYSKYASNTEIEKTTNYTDAQKKEAVVKFLDRPNQPMFFHNCKELTVTGIKMINAPCWTLTTSECEDVKITSITIDNDYQISNSDGIHVSACKDVMIANCNISAGDDCIAITGITAWEKTSENIVVTNCVLSSRSACVRVGHEASKVKNVTVSNIVMIDSNRGICMFANKGGYIKNVTFNGIIMQTRKFASGWWANGEPLVVYAFKGGVIENVSVSNVKAEVENSIVVYGEGINGLLLENWNIEVSQGSNVNHFKPLYNLLPAPFVESPDPLKHIPWIYVEKAKGIILRNINAQARITHVPFSITPVIKESAVIKAENPSLY